jgi:2-iminoacetate synthase
MSFSEVLSDARWRVDGYAKSNVAYSVAGVRELDPSAAQLLWSEDLGTGGNFDSEIFSAAVRAKSRRFAGGVYAVVPVYVTSVCIERCVYCNYRIGNKGVEVERLRLSPDQLAAEVNFLAAEKGLRVMELVYATDPQVRVDRMCRDVELTRKVLEQYGGGTVGINAEALDESEYRQLRDAGLNFSVLWQETYDKERYVEYHPGTTKKTHFEYRVEAYERMLVSGIDAIGMGVLSGLSDWRTDWALMMEHEAYIAKRYGITPAIIGVPRLKPAAGALVKETTHIPSRQEFKCAIAVHNLFSPSTLPFLNTREDWPFCRELAAGGGALFTFNCSTIPGGYAAGKHGYQFPTGSFDAPSFAPRLAADGIRSIFDWKFVGSDPVAAEKSIAAIAGA